ncbi:MAG: rhodanese-like domain-containing protein [Pseudomonadota bacterium]
MLEDPFHLPTISATRALQIAREGATLIDLRKTPTALASGHRISGALSRNPFEFNHLDPLTQAQGKLVTFCVHGHEVSQFACALLLLHGRDSCYVTGGYEALVAAGATLEDIRQ